MKRLMYGVLAAAVVLSAGVAVAQAAPGSGGPSGGSAASMRKFQKDTLALRDDLAAKRVDLREEQNKPEPDAARIASLRKDIVDLETKIDTAANKYGVRAWGRGHGRGMMHAGKGPGGCGCCW